MIRLFISIIFASLIYTHPSWGIVVLKNGDIYFVDVLHNSGTLWKLDPTGKLSAIKKNIHAHNLVLDNSGTLWVGDEKWIQGQIEGDGQHTLYSISKTGKETLLFQHDDYDKFNATNFIVSSKQEIFFSINGHIAKYRPDKIGLILNTHKFQRIMTLFMDQRDHIWIADNNTENGSVFRMDLDGNIEKIASNILPHSPKDPIFKEKNIQILLGMYSENKNSVYIANNSTRSVDFFTKEGTRKRIYKSNEKWYPVGITKFNDIIYIMECGYDRRNTGPRVIKLNPDGSTELLIDLTNL